MRGLWSVALRAMWVNRASALRLTEPGCGLDLLFADELQRGAVFLGWFAVFPGFAFDLNVVVI